MNITCEVRGKQKTLTPWYHAMKSKLGNPYVYYSPNQLFAWIYFTSEEHKNHLINVFVGILVVVHGSHYVGVIDRWQERREEDTEEGYGRATSASHWQLPQDVLLLDIPTQVHRCDEAYLGNFLSYLHILWCDSCIIQENVLSISGSNQDYVVLAQNTIYI